jgi:hypothetical protein
MMRTLLGIGGEGLQRLVHKSVVGGVRLVRPTAAPSIAIVVTPTSATVSEKEMDEQIKPKSSGDERRAQDPSAPTTNEQGNGQGNVNKRDRDHQIKEKNKPPAIKLQIGNLSYKTQPNNLYDFSTGLYGKGSVLECHIPTERGLGILMVLGPSPCRTAMQRLHLKSDISTRWMAVF